MKKTQRTLREISKIVESTIATINASAKKYRDDHKVKAMPDQLFQDLIVRTCIKNKISESHIRTVAGWKDK